MSIRFWVCVLLGVFAFSAHAQDPRTTIQTRWLGEQSPRELEVKTGLVSYIFSEAGGTLKSVYLYFSAPWGNPPVEILPDVKVKPEDLSRLYTEGALFPFALTVGAVSQEAPYQAEILPSDNPKLQRVTFTHQSDVLKIAKTFTVINEPYYTVGVELRLENLSAEALALPEGFQMTLGAGVQDARSEARFLFDGVRATEVVQNFKSFEGLGFVGNNFVLWLSTDPVQKRYSPLGERRRQGQEALRGALGGADAGAGGEPDLSLHALRGADQSGLSRASRAAARRRSRPMEPSPRRSDKASQSALRIHGQLRVGAHSVHSDHSVADVPPDARAIPLDGQDERSPA
jgi:hypothetical protein